MSRTRPVEEKHPEDRPVTDAQRIAELQEQADARLIEQKEADERIAAIRARCRK
jgi:hypothetical protein